ncbi:MAG TPA: plastocyanin/azurin family copper-binding protein [Saprospiraceae bacterium]|nr:plastocyanin/azurin family copper-binding protein [Saprospiraceae bacterium]
MQVYKIFIFSLLCLFFGQFSLHGQSMLMGKESVFYPIEKVPIPEDIILEVGGLTFTDDGKMGVTTRRGELWVIENPGSEQPSYTRFAHGLHEPLGLTYHDGAFWCVQRPELTKITDTDDDGKADQYQQIYTWPLDGNYHEYGYGPMFTPEGDMIVALNLGWVGRGISNSKWRGWMLKITQDGEMSPIATGMRSPAGMGFNANGELFYAENQGDWVGSGRITHVEAGDFVGNPEGLKWANEPKSNIDINFDEITDTMGYTLYEYAQKKSGIKPPTVWFPHTLMGISTSDIILIEDDRFGPFTGQLLVGDQGHSKIMRVALEEVNGVYQGAVFGFREGFASGVLRMIWGPDQDLYVGGTNRGWASTGKDPYALERLRWTGRTPFEMKAISATADGFEIEFTQPVDRVTAANPENYEIVDFTYKYHHFYGSPVQDMQDRTVFKVELSQDARKARLYVEGLRPGYIYEVKVPGVENQQGENVMHNTGYYTLNQIPGGSQSQATPSENSSAAADDGRMVEVKSPKRVTKMPASWTNGPDEELVIAAEAGMVYDKELMVVKAGSKVKLTFNNPDDMIHNLIITEPDAADAVGQAALEMGLQGPQKGFIPDMEEVIFHTNILEPNSNDVIYFEAPSQPGDYQYVCTFPGHARTMRGILRVE